ncbi:hypothetical protein J8Z86_19975, partial [Yersinia enterocolitica]|uniref:hypothetical protein n=1 Tax=Yersinia enterocolitica TaxID=630 RepID=UPI001C8D4EB7
SGDPSAPERGLFDCVSATAQPTVIRLMHFLRPHQHFYHKKLILYFGVHLKANIHHGKATINKALSHL